MYIWRRVFFVGGLDKGYFGMVMIFKCFLCLFWTFCSWSVLLDSLDLFKWFILVWNYIITCLSSFLNKFFLMKKFPKNGLFWVHNFFSRRATMLSIDFETHNRGRSTQEHYFYRHIEKKRSLGPVVLVF